MCSRAGLSPSDSLDLIQDVWVWLLKERRTHLALEAPWLSAVFHNFVRRRYRQTSRLAAREGSPLTSEPTAPTDLPRIERDEVLGLLSVRLPGTQRRLLALIRLGYTVAEATRILKIPRGTAAYLTRKLVERARRRLRSFRDTD